MKPIVVFGLKNQIGGIENYLLSAQRQLRDTYEMRFLVESDGTPVMHLPTVTENNGKIIPIPMGHPVKAYAEGLDRVLREQRKETDTLYVNVGDLSMNMLLALILGKRHGYKIVTHSHSAREEVVLSSTVVKIRHFIIKHVSLRMLRSKKFVRIAVSERAGRFHYSGRDFTLIPPGIYCEKFMFSENVRRAVRSEYGIDDDTILIGFVGRMVDVKNPLYPIALMEKLRDKSVKLLMVGDGPMLETMREKVTACGLEEKVILVGASNRVPEYVQAFDLLIATSHSEGLGLMVVEARAAGVPVICSAGNFPEELGRISGIGFVPLDEPEKWIEAVIQTEFVPFEERRKANKEVSDSIYNETNIGKSLSERL